MTSGHVRIRPAASLPPAERIKKYTVQLCTSMSLTFCGCNRVGFCSSLTWHAVRYETLTSLSNMDVVGCYQRWSKAASRCHSRCVEQEHLDARSQGDDGRATGPLRTTPVPAGLPAVQPLLLVVLLLLASALTEKLLM